MITDRLQTGDATISADATFDDGPFVVHGVAQAAEVTQGVSGQRRYWPPEVLEDAAEKLVGTPIVDPDDHRELDAGQPHPEIIVGEVTDAAFDADREALVYEAEIDDPDRARQIARGRVDVSPSVALERGEEDPERDAERVAAVVAYRDLAIVADGAHASASIQPGTAEALARHFDGLQSPVEANDVDVDVSPPERVVNAAEAAQQAAENGLIPDSCGTGVGDDRMAAIINDDLQPADFVTRFRGRTPVPAYLTSHAGDTTTDDPPTEWAADLWERCGNAQQAKWGWYTEWAQRTANEIMRALDEAPIYEGLQRSRARTPDYGGTQDAEWSTPTLDEYLRGYDSLPDPDDVDSVDDLSQDDRSLIARKSLLGTPSAETLREVRFFPVVDPATDELNRRALGAVRSGRGEQANITDDARASARRVAGRLLDDEFGAEVDADATESHMSQYQIPQLVTPLADTGEPVHLVYEDEADAVASSEMLGLDGAVHEHELEGTTVYAPGATHSEFLNAVDDVAESVGAFPADDEERMAAVEDVQQGTLVRWTSGGDRPAYGRIEEVRTEGDAPLDGEIDGDPDPIQPPAALIEVHRPDGDGGWQPSGTMVGHTLNTDTLTVIEELPDPESLANHRDGDDGSHGSTGQSLPDDGSLSDPLMDDITDEERELLAASRQLDDPTVIETDAAERLSDHEELIEAAGGIDEPTVVSESDYETLEARVDEVREVLADALQEQTGLSDTAIEAMPFEALATEFETDEGTLNVEALAQSPETGSGPSDPDLSDEERERKAEIEERLETLSGEDNAIAERETERLESELETITGGEA